MGLSVSGSGPSVPDTYMDRQTPELLFRVGVRPPAPTPLSLKDNIESFKARI